MKSHTWYLAMAMLLIVSDLAVLACDGWPVRTTPSGDDWTRVTLALLTMLGAASLTNVCAQVVPAQNALLGGRCADRERATAPIPVEARVQADV
jgi:hypothetical protein